MKVTGYTLREAIAQWVLRRDAASGAFNPSLRAFPGETKDPGRVALQLEEAERNLAKLQVAQMRYNLHVIVEVGGEKITLGEAIKRVGGLGRIEKMWKSAIGDSKKNSYLSDDEVRDPNQQRSSRTISSEDAMERARLAGKKAAAFRAAIATANGREVHMENLDAALFE